ncbi:hypothetical protein L3X38_032939 [Prunus dulcis]|uniref:Integrase catalytic domain-containing protein n=1 Tax=Prunus dulcis TaxID=3755 RepID=A0AAD4VH58_PRUDU|nr:hypothetical protein L3X38_032939 [Prunus dulcis]
MEQIFHEQFYRLEPEFLMANLAKMRQGSNVSVQEYLGKFREAKARCTVNMPEHEFVKLAQGGLLLDLGRSLRDLIDRKVFKFPEKATMGVDQNPFPNAQANMVVPPKAKEPSREPTRESAKEQAQTIRPKSAGKNIMKSSAENYCPYSPRDMTEIRPNKRSLHEHQDRYERPRYQPKRRNLQMPLRYEDVDLLNPSRNQNRSIWVSVGEGKNREVAYVSRPRPADGSGVPTFKMPNTKAEKQSLSSVFERWISPEVMVLTVTPDNWRHEIVSYLKDPNGPHSQQVLRRARYYVIKDKILFRIGSDDLLMKCLAKKEQRIAMTEVHEGICGAHQASIKMRWLLRRHGYFWPTILKDCIEYAKGFQDCQRHGLVPHVPTEPMNPIVKAWPFKGWAMDVIGQIHPELSKGHKYILVATDFFKKWVEAVPLKKVTQVEVLEFIEKIIIHRFGLPESIMTDRGTAFMGKAVQATARNWGVRMVQSTPYNPQSSGQAEASNKVIKGILGKMIENNPKEWHSLLSNTLWAYRTSRRSGTGMTPFTLTYGHDAVLPLEIFVRSLRVARHGEWSKYVYNQAMAQELDDLEEVRLDALDKLKAQKETVSRAYDKKTKAKSFEVRDLVWKTILPTRSKDPKFGKWSPTWEGPFLIHQILGKRAYKLSTEMGESMMHQSMADF